MPHSDALGNSRNRCQRKSGFTSGIRYDRVRSRMSYQDTHLWNRTLGEVPNDRWVRERATLRQAFESLRANMKWFLENIGCDLPHFTVHDVTHSDALWEMADLILGESYQITPIEAFILGATFLVHDAGMSAAARDETAFESSVRWRDSLALAIRRLTGRTPNEAEIAAVDQNTKREVFENLLRETHSEAVTQLLTKEWRECLPADNLINTGPSEIILDKSPRLCHREMDASPQSRWLLGSGEGTRTESRVPAAAIGARTGGERALAEATGTSAASQQAKCRTVFQGGTQK